MRHDLIRLPDDEAANRERTDRSERPRARYGCSCKGTDYYGPTGIGPGSRRQAPPVHLFHRREERMRAQGLIR